MKWPVRIVKISKILSALVILWTFLLYLYLRSTDRWHDPTVSQVIAWAVIFLFLTITPGYIASNVLDNAEKRKQSE